MKKISIVYLALILFFSCAVPTSAQTTDGFRGFKWGTDISKMKSKFGLKLKEKAGHSRIYTSNVHSIGTVKLTYCYFTFYRNKFSDVLIIAEEFTGTHDLLDILKEKYGDDYSEFESVNTFIWHTEGTTVGYIGDLPKNSATVYLQSDSLDQEIKNDKAEEAKEGAKDF